MAEPPQHELRSATVVAGAIGGLGAGLSAAAATLCCVGPGVVSLLGVGGAVAAAALKPYRPVLLLGSVLLLGAAFWLAYRPAAAAGAGAACPTRLGRLVRAVLWTAAVTWIAALVLPR